MKIRIEGNSVRLRLGKSEVFRLAAEGRVANSTQFPEGRFIYRLTLQSGLGAMEAHLGPEGITVILPEAWGRAWPGEERIGFETLLKPAGGGELHLLVEKDFICLDRDPARQPDQYPHPSSQKKQA